MVLITNLGTMDNMHEAKRLYLLNCIGRQGVQVRIDHSTIKIKCANNNTESYDKWNATCFNL